MLLGANAILTYDVRLGYKTEAMYEDRNSEWILEAQSRESRSIQCQPIYHYGSETKVIFTVNSSVQNELFLFFLEYS